MCATPFNCDAAPIEDWEPSWWKEGLITIYRDPNYRPWCYEDYKVISMYAECLVTGNYTNFAQLRKNHVLAEGTKEFQASYCFLSGHCSNTHINLESKQEDAHEACGNQYGQSSWDVVNYNQLPAYIDFGVAITNKTQAKVQGMIACAKGSYHCDVLECQETWCQDPHYLEKYADLLDEQNR